MFFAGLGLLMAGLGGYLIYRGIKFRIIADIVEAIVFILVGIALIIL